MANEWVIPEIAANHDEMTAWRRDIHAHPELGFEEVRTSELVAEKLKSWGLEVHTGLGKTGVVGTLRVGNDTRSIGLRADMDALPMPEANQFDYRSTKEDVMHACGHDGHTTMLLGAAKYLAETKNFEGCVHFIFQPAEEGVGGAKAMVEEGLLNSSHATQSMECTIGLACPLVSLECDQDRRWQEARYLTLLLKEMGRTAPALSQGLIRL